MNTTKDKKIKILKTAIVLLLSIGFGYLLAIPIKSQAASSPVTDQVASNTNLVVLVMMVGALGLVVWILQSKSKKNRFLQTIANLFRNIKGLISGVEHKLLRVNNTPAPLFTITPTDHEQLQDAENKAKLLSKYNQLNLSYTSVNEGNKKAQTTTMTQKDKQRSAQLLDLAQAVLNNLAIIESLGQTNTQEIIEVDNTKMYGEKTHKDKAEAKMKEIELAMFVLMSEHATNISRDIDNITLPESYEIEDRVEAVRAEGERLLALIKERDTPISTESEFVLDKIVNQRINELWSDYTDAKESFFDEEVGMLDLSTAKKENPDLAIKEALTDIEAIFKEVNTSIQTSKEARAINRLMITKNYFNNR